MKKLCAPSFLVVCFCVLGFSQEGNGIGSGQTVRNNIAATAINILSKPRANYTDGARENDIEGVVRLRVTFLASGEIGVVTPVTALPYGLTEMAIAAAKQIKFQPAMRDGKPISVTKLIEYSFYLYYDEKDKALKEKAKILDMPLPEHPREENLKTLRGKVSLELVLNPSGEINILRVSTELPKEFEIKAREAASKIKFKPAIHKNGKQVSQVKKIDYEFKPQKK